MPSRVINNSTPLERLFKVSPDYSSLEVFGCACWPNLRTCNTKKFEFHSKQCVFVGYSPIRKGYKCLDKSTRRIYISRDVIFEENIFPFATMSFVKDNQTSSYSPSAILLPMNSPTIESVPHCFPNKPAVEDGPCGSDPVTTNDSGVETISTDGQPQDTPLSDGE